MARIKIEVEIGDEHYAALPGCGDIVVSYGVFIEPQHRRKGYGTIAHKNRLEELAKHGYTGVICTCRRDNTAQLKILESNGWTKAWEFWTKEHDCPVFLYVRVLP